MALNIRGDRGLYYKTGIDTAGLKKGATKSKGILAGLKSSITKTDVFFAIGVSAGLAFTKASKAMYQFSKEFEQNMLEVATISKIVSNDFEGMSLKIMELSRQFPQSALILTKGLYQIVSAGYDTAQALDILRESTKLATAAVTDTFIAADAITSVMNAYTDSVSGAAEVSDKLFTIVRLGKTTMAELGPHITMVTGLAAQAGMTFEELSAIVAESVKTLKTPMAMTGIRGLLTAIMKPTEDTIKLMEDLKLVTGETGFEFNIATARSMGYVDFLKKVMELTKGDIALLAQMFPNIRGLTGLLSIATDEGNRLSAAMEEIAKSTKDVDVAVETMAKSTTNKIKIMTNNIIADLKVYGDAMVDIGSKVAEETNSFLSFLRTISAVELESRAAFRLWYDDIYFFLDDLTKKALDFNEAISGEKLPVTGKEQFPTTRREQPSGLFTEQQLKSIGEQLLGYIAPPRPLIYPKELKDDPEDYAKFVAKRAALMREAAKLTKTYEEKVTEIRAHYAELRGVVDDKEGKNRLKALESKEIKVLYEKTFADRIENEKRMTEELERERERQEDFTVEMTLLREKQDTRNRKLDEDYRDFKISNNEEMLEDEIEYIESQMELYDERTNFERGLIDELEKREEQLRRLRENALKLTEKQQKLLAKNIQNMNIKTIESHIKLLEIERDKFVDNVELYLYWQGKIDEAIVKTSNIRLESIQDISDALRSLGNLIGEFDSKLGNVINRTANVVREAGKLKEALESKNIALQFASSLDIASSYINIMNEIFKKTDTSNDRILIAMQKQNSLIEKQINLLHRARGEEELAGRYDLLVAINKQLELNKKNLLDIKVVAGESLIRLGDIFGEDVQKILAGGKFTKTKFALEIGGDFFVMSKETRDMINLLIDDIERAQLSLIDYGEELKEVLTGTTTESIAAAITDGLMEGLDSAQVFADTFEDLMRNALLHAFETRTLMRLLDPFFDKFAELAEGGLTREEIDELKIMWLGTKRKGKLGGEFDVPGISDAIEGAFEGMKRFMEEIGISLIDKEADGVSATRTGMAGAIRGITERTAGILAGQLGAMRLDVRQIRDRLLGEDEAVDLINAHLLAISQKASTQKNMLNEIMISNWAISGYTKATWETLKLHGLAISQKMSSQNNILNEIMYSGWTTSGWTKGTMNHTLAISQKLSDQKNMLNEIMHSGWTIGGWTRGTLRHSEAISLKLSDQKVMLNDIRLANWDIGGYTQGAWDILKEIKPVNMDILNTAMSNLQANIRTADNTEIISEHTVNLEHMNNRLTSIDSSLKNGSLNLTLNDTSMLRASGTN